MFASSGEVIPNRIPVKQAVELLIAEYRPAELRYHCDFSTQFGASVTDPARARTTLAQAKAVVRSDGDLAQEIAHQAPSNGFDVSVDFFSAQRWNQLRACTVSD
jgi:hypothetical protein